MAARRKGAVEAGVDRDLKALPAVVRGGALAATALVLARELDDVGNSATSKSMCARALSEALDKLRAVAPEESREDGVDDLAAARAARRSGT